MGLNGNDFARKQAKFELETIEIVTAESGKQNAASFVENSLAREARFVVASLATGTACHSLLQNATEILPPGAYFHSVDGMTFRDAWVFLISDIEILWWTGYPLEHRKESNGRVGGEARQAGRHIGRYCRTFRQKEAMVPIHRQRRNGKLLRRASSKLGRRRAQAI